MDALGRPRMSRELIKLRAVELSDKGLKFNVIYEKLKYEYPEAGIKYSTVKDWCTRYKDDIRKNACQSEVSPLPVKDTHTKPLVVETGGSFFAERGLNIAVMADRQVKPNIDLDYLRWQGLYLASEKPDVIIDIGDFADMPSCSMHDAVGSKSFAAQNYKEDILAVHRGMKAFMEPIQAEMQRSGWNPRLIMCLGNHEHRIVRTLEAIPKLDGLIGLPDLEYERWGFEVFPFLQPVEVAGITFSHYFPSGQMGRPISSARAMLTKLHTSAVAGHQQGRDIAFGKRANGKQITCIIAGSAYVHDEDYLNPQTNNHWRGFYMLNDCVDGEFEEKAVSMKYLRRRYGEAAQNA